jgi:hypothetical protein
MSEGNPTTKNQERPPMLSDYLARLDKVIAQKEGLLKKAQAQEWSVGKSGFPVEPDGVTNAREELNRLNAIRSLLTSELRDALRIEEDATEFKEIQTTEERVKSASIDEAVAMLERGTQMRYKNYQNQFGTTDPKDVVETQREAAQRQMNEIKFRDKISSDLSSFSL